MTVLHNAPACVQVWWWPSCLRWWRCASWAASSMLATTPGYGIHSILQHVNCATANNMQESATTLVLTIRAMRVCLADDVLLIAGDTASRVHR